VIAAAVLALAGGAWPKPGGVDHATRLNVNGVIASGGTAGGTFELHTTLGRVLCDTGSVGWTARHR
jgi:hypothetical protein